MIGFMILLGLGCVAMAIHHYRKRSSYWTAYYVFFMIVYTAMITAELNK